MEPHKQEQETVPREQVEGTTYTTPTVTPMATPTATPTTTGRACVSEKDCGAVGDPSSHRLSHAHQHHGQVGCGKADAVANKGNEEVPAAASHKTTDAPTFTQHTPTRLHKSLSPPVVVVQGLYDGAGAEGKCAGEGRTPSLR